MRSASLAALFTSAAFMNAAMAAASAMSTLVAADQLSPALAGLPATAGVAGTGLGALVLSRLMGRFGRRAGLVAGYASALAGAVLATAAVRDHDVAALSAGLTLLGIGNAGALLSRYAAAELYPPQRRGVAIGAVIWAGTAGAVGGPLAMTPAQDAARAAGWEPASGPFALAALAALGALVTAIAAPRTVPERARAARRAPVFEAPAIRSAAATVVTAQVVMVAVMTTAPLSMHMRGHDLRAIGAVVSAHTLGMFALAPLSGWLVDRLGGRAVMLLGLATLAASAGWVATSPDGIALTVALFALGYGWNLGVVGGSGVLTRQGTDTTRAQGAIDALSWGTSTIATMASTVLFVHGGYPALSTAAAAACALPLLVLLRSAERPRDAGRPEAVALVEQCRP